MRIRKDQTWHKLKNIEDFLIYKQLSTDDFRKSISQSRPYLIVAIDIEGQPGVDTAQIGVAITSKINLEKSSEGLRAFYYSHAIKVTTIQIRERPNDRPWVQPYHYGDLDRVESEEAAVQKLQDLIHSELRHHQDVVLIGFGLDREMQWISWNCPSITALFSGWFDMQDLATERIGTKQTIGLSATLKRLQIIDNRDHSGNHASTDALRCLCIIPPLLADQLPEITYENTRPRDISLFCRIPSMRYGHSQNTDNHPFVVRVTTASGGRLPLAYATSRSVWQLFKDHDLKGVGMNQKTTKYDWVGVRLWWLSFKTESDRDRFLREVHGMALEDVRLMLIPEFPPEKQEYGVGDDSTISPPEDVAFLRNVSLHGPLFESSDDDFEQNMYRWIPTWLKITQPRA